MNGPARVPPRFVPTLTTVVEAPLEVSAPPPAPPPPAPPAPLTEWPAGPPAEVEATEEPADWFALDAPEEPEPEPDPEPEPAHEPAHEPTDDQDQPDPDPAPAEAASAPGILMPTPDQIALHPISEAELFGIEEQLLHRVLQRIDLSLEERLTDTVSAAVQQQLDAMLPRLRTEIEQVLRSLVVEALAEELSENTGSAPTTGPESFG